MEKISIEVLKNDEDTLGCEYKFLNWELNRYVKPDFVFVATSGIFEAVRESRKACIEDIKQQRENFIQRQIERQKKRATL